MPAIDQLDSAAQTWDMPPTKTKRLVGWFNPENVSIVVIYILLIAAWEYFGHDVSPFLSSYPSAIIHAFVALFQSGDLALAFGESLNVLILGLAFTFLVGLPLGYGIGRSKTIDAVVGPIVTALFVAPRVVFVPLLVLWFGLTDTSRIVLVVLSGVFPLIYNVADGMRSLSAAYVDVARAYGASELQIVREVTVPAVLPFIGVGTQQAIVRAMTGLVVAEFFVGLSGLGGLLQRTSSEFELADSFALIFILVFVGFVLTSIGDYYRGPLGRWRRTQKAFRD